MIGSASDLESRLAEIVRSSPLLMCALRAARAVDPPDWLIGAGTIRDVVWDFLHGAGESLGVRDVDLVFFDRDSLDGERERNVLEAVTEKAPGIPWDVKNQAAVHVWYPRDFGVEIEPLLSSADAVATWPETASAVAVRLLADESIRVVAPCGLQDLFGMIWRRNPRRVTIEEYHRRIQNKPISVRWPQVRILREAADD